MGAGVDAPCACIDGKFLEDVTGPAAAQDRAGANAAERSAQRNKAVVQPPALRAADLPAAGSLVVENVDGDHRPFGCGGGEGRMIVEPQVLPQPANGRHGGFLVDRPCLWINRPESGGVLPALSRKQYR